MDRQAEAKRRYEELKESLADDKKVRKKASRARVIGLAIVGGWVIAPVAAWDVDLESARRPEFFRNPTPHEAHLLSLPRGTSGEAAPAREWEAASYRAIDAPLLAGRAYREIGVFPEDSPQALGLRVTVPEGQRIHLQLEGEGEGEELPPFFLDLFREAPDSLIGAPSGAEAEALPEGRTDQGSNGQTGPSPAPHRRPAFVSGGELSAGRWVFDAPETAEYVLRIQPRLGVGGRYQVSIRVGAPWHFPVAGGAREDIGSVFGDPRDGGRRQHHGVDIFAPRGTPALAAADGRITSVDTTNIGGRVVWLREANGRRAIYYAHLDQPLVEDGQQVRAGDTIGLVGNTGNARTTPPHLHFGAYQRGPRDPWDLILPIPPPAPEVAVSLDGLGREGRVGEAGVRLRSAPSTRGSILEELPRESAFRILGGAGQWFRIVLQGGQSGFIHSRFTSMATPGGTRPSNQQ